MKIWSWRHAVAQAKLEPLTKLVLYTLAIHMNETGGGCYPSIDTIMAESGMARATVIKHLDLAATAGFIRRRKHGYGGQKWARNEYVATYPKGCTLADSEDIEKPEEKGGSTGELPFGEPDKGSSNERQKAVQEVNSNSPLNSPSSDSNESGDGAPVDFKRVLFTEGIKLLGGNPNKNRSLVGRWLRDFGEQAVVAAMLEAQKQSAVEPKAYIEKVLKQGGKKANAAARHSGFEQQDYRADTGGFYVP